MGTDIETADTADLMRVWDDYSRRGVWESVRERGGNPAIVASALAKLSEVTPLEALEANRRLVGLLTGRRWYVMQAAREAGATWLAIGEALGMTKQGAQDWYRRTIAEQERHVPEYHDADRARAALGDLPDDAPGGSIMCQHDYPAAECPACQAAYERLYVLDNRARLTADELAERRSLEERFDLR